MYLSQIMLSRTNCYRLRITDDYSIHRVVYDLFGDGHGKEADTDQPRFLYADRGMNEVCRSILVMSDILPRQQDDIIVQTKKISDAFLRQKRYAFEIILNPVRRNHKTRKREPIIGQQMLRDWFLKKALDSGFEVDPQRLMVHTLPTMVFPNSHGCQTVFNRVKFNGVMTVSDPEKFVQSFQTGIGSAKAFGFGLLQLQPIPED